MINGIINIYKESGYTSHDVVAKMRGILKQKKIGHTGTLDPDAVGVLPVCLGSGTKLCDMLTDKSKEYEAKMLLGITTDTQDTSGEIVTQKDVNVTQEQVSEAILSFVGEYEQIPPMYSAIKVNGKKLYELAREGKEIERKPRRVSIDYIQIIKVELPYVTMKVGCSKGTYIRTLCYDIGEKLGCGAAMAGLKRTKVGQFTLDTALTLSEVEAARDSETLADHIVSVDSVFTHMDAVIIQDKFVRLIENGNSFYPNQIKEIVTEAGHAFGKKADWKDGQEMRVYDTAKRFYGIYAYDANTHRFSPVKMFLEQ